MKLRTIRRLRAQIKDQKKTLDIMWNLLSNQEVTPEKRIQNAKTYLEKKGFRPEWDY